jgi:hypothetical protein
MVCVEVAVWCGRFVPLNDLGNTIDGNSRGDLTEPSFVLQNSRAFEDQAEHEHLVHMRARKDVKGDKTENRQNACAAFLGRCALLSEAIPQRPNSPTICRTACDMRYGNEKR